MVKSSYYIIWRNKKKTARSRTPEKKTPVNEKEKDSTRLRINSTVKANKMERIDKATMEIIKAHGMQANDDGEASTKLLKAKGIDKLLNLI